MNTALHYNSPVRSCLNCAHRHGYGEMMKCARSGMYCENARRCISMTAHHCDVSFHGWQPRKPHRSLFAWLRDVIWKP